MILINYLKKSSRLSKILLGLLTIFIIGIIMCSYFGFVISDNKDKNEAEKIVFTYLQAKKNNDYDTWNSTFFEPYKDDDYILEKRGDLGVLNLEIEEVTYSKGGTAFAKKMYIDSDLAHDHKWTSKYLNENLIVVYSAYSVEYDHTKFFYEDGEIKEYVYLLRDNKDSPWRIWQFGYAIN